MRSTTQLLKELVSIPSINPMGRDLKGPEIYEHRLTDYLESLFQRLGVACERQPVAPEVNSGSPSPVPVTADQVRRVRCRWRG